MLGGNHHGALGNPNKISSGKISPGNYLYFDKNN